MRITKGSESIVVTGLYLFDRGVEFTKGDFVIDNGLIYLVTEDVNGYEDIHDSKYKEYSLINAVSDTEDLMTTNDNKLVTTNVLKSLVNNYVRGLSYGGSVELLRVNRDTDLNNFTYNCVYGLDISVNEIGNNFPPELDRSVSHILLFRTFVINTDTTYIIQEITDFINGVIYIRTLRNETVIKPWTTFSSVNSISSISQSFNNSVTELKNGLDKFDTINTNYLRTCMIDLTSHLPNNGQLTPSSDVSILESEINIDNVHMTNVKALDVIMKFKTSDKPSIFTQDSFRIDISKILNDTTEDVSKLINKCQVSVSKNLLGNKIIFKVAYSGSDTIFRDSLTISKLIGIKWVN